MILSIIIPGVSSSIKSLLSSLSYSDNQLAMNLGEAYLVTNSGNERLG